MTLTRPRLAGSPFAALARMIEACGGVRAVAEFVNRAESSVYKWTDPEQSDGAPFGIVAQLAAHFGAAEAAEHLAARSGGIFLPIPDAKAGGRWAELSAEAAKESGEVFAEIMLALAPKGDGGSAVTRAEALRLLSEVDDLLSVLSRLRGLAQGVIDEGEGR